MALTPNPDGFEDGATAFPNTPWSTGGAGDWAIASDRAFSGESSLKSPDLVGITNAIANATLHVCDGFRGGSLQLQAWASVLPPNDIFFVYVDGEVGQTVTGVFNWTEVAVLLSPGPHVIEFSYQYDTFGVDPLPPSPPQREGEFCTMHTSL